MKPVGRMTLLVATLLCVACVKKPVTAPRAVIPDTGRSAASSSTRKAPMSASAPLPSTNRSTR